MNQLITFIIFLLFFISYNGNTGHLTANTPKPIEKHPSVQKVISYPIEDSILQIQSYTFTTPDFDLFNPIAALTESGEMALLTRSGLYFFNGKILRRIPSDSRVSSSHFNNLWVTEDGWVWMANKSRELLPPISNPTFYNYRTNTFLSGDEFFNRTPLEGKKLVNIVCLHKKKIVLNTIDGEIFIYEHGKIRALDLEKKNLLIGKGPNFEIITREKTSNGIIIKLLDLKNDSIRKLPKLNTDREVFLSFMKDGFLYALLGFDGQDGMYIYNLNKTHREWRFHSNDLGLHSYGSEQGSHFFGYLDAGQIHEVQGYDLMQSERAEMIHQILSPETPLKQISTAFGDWRFNGTGLHFVWKSPNKMNGIAGNNFLSGKSTRKLKFQGDTLFSAATHSGFYEIDLTHFPEKSAEFIRDTNLLDCQKYYCLNFFFQNGRKLILIGEEVIVYDYKDKSCREFLAPDGHKLEIWGFENLAPNRFILGSVTGPLLLSKTEEDNYRIDEMYYSTEYSNYNKIGINRIKRKNQSDTLMLCTNAGLVLAKWEETNERNIQVLEMATPNKIVYDAEFLTDNSLFIATHYSGLLWLNPEDEFNTIFEYNRNNYFKSNTAHNIQTDEEDRLWIGTNHGLYLINPKERQTRSLNAIDGFINDEFNRLSSAKSPSGLLAFGGINGVSVFDPNAFKIIDEEKNIALDKIILYDHSGRMTHLYPGAQDTLIKIQAGSNTKEAVFIFEGGLLQNQAELFVRKVGKNDFWTPLKESKISIREIENSNDVYELKVISPDGSTVVYPATFSIILAPSYSGLTWALVLILLVAIYSVYRRWSLSEKLTTVTQTTSVDKGTEESIFRNKVVDPEEKITQADNLSSFYQKYDEKEQSHFLEHHKQNDPFVKKLNEVVLENIDSKTLTVDFIAQLFHQSSRQFHRNVVDSTGLTPNKYIRFLRLQKAREIISENPEINVSEVSYRVGFGKASYFSKVFKELYGISPKKYQKKLFCLKQNQNSEGE